MTTKQTPTLRRRRDLNELVRDTLALTAANWRTLLVVALAIVVPVELVVYGFGLGWLTSGYAVPTLGVSLLEVGVSYLLEGPLVTAMAIAVLLQVDKGKGTSSRAAIQRGLDVFVPLLLAAALYALVVAAGFLTIVLGVLAAVRLALYIPAVAIEERSPIDALRRSAQLTRGAFWRVLGRMLVLSLILVIPGSLITGIFDALAESADAQALHLVGSMLSGLFAVPIAAVYTTLLYFDLVERHSAPAAAG